MSNYRYGIILPESVFIFKNKNNRDEWLNENTSSTKLSSKEVHHKMNMKRSIVRSKIYQAKEDMVSNNLKFIKLSNNEL